MGSYILHHPLGYPMVGFFQSIVKSNSSTSMVRHEGTLSKWWGRIISYEYYRFWTRTKSMNKYNTISVVCYWERYSLLTWNFSCVKYNELIIQFLFIYLSIHISVYLWRRLDYIEFNNNKYYLFFSTTFSSFSTSF